MVAAVVSGLVLVALSAGVIGYVSTQPNASGPVLPDASGATLEDNGTAIAALRKPPVWDDEDVWRRIAAGEGRQAYLKAPVLCDLPEPHRPEDEFERRDMEARRLAKASACFDLLTRNLQAPKFAVYSIPVQSGTYDFEKHIYDLVLRQARLFEDQLWVIETVSEPVELTGALSLGGVRSTVWSELEAPDGSHDVHLRLAMDERTARDLHRRLGTFATVTVDVAFETKGYGSTEVSLDGAPVMGLLGHAIAYRVADVDGPYFAWIPFGLDKDGKSPPLPSLATATGVEGGGD